MRLRNYGDINVVHKRGGNNRKPNTSLYIGIKCGSRTVIGFDSIKRYDSDRYNVVVQKLVYKCECGVVGKMDSSQLNKRFRERGPYDCKHVIIKHEVARKYKVYEENMV